MSIQESENEMNLSEALVKIVLQTVRTEMYNTF